MGLTPYLGIERGNIACHKSEARFGTLLREGRLASRALRDEVALPSQFRATKPCN
ncbi:orf129b [Dorcoceras hygrometricum]|uniref:Orf129b n=1 Tax=Dorcoceras hygrometricum TaxID=472368 RepID=A0A2Z7DAW5_9LAMI|nr:orf129b [Dorcoceras hygrometricum]